MAPVIRAALAILLIGCGEPPVDGAYVGEPLFELAVRVGAGPYATPDMRITLLWSAEPGGLDPAAWVEHGPRFAPLPAVDGTLRLFDPPPVSGIGRLVAYEASDGRWRADAPVFGVSDAAIVYAPGVGYFARAIGDVCCLDDLAACADCCAPTSTLLALHPDAPIEAPCAAPQPGEGT